MDRQQLTARYIQVFSIIDTLNFAISETETDRYDDYMEILEAECRELEELIKTTR